MVAARLGDHRLDGRTGPDDEHAPTEHCARVLLRGDPVHGYSGRLLPAPPMAVTASGDLALGHTFGGGRNGARRRGDTYMVSAAVPSPVATPRAGPSPSQRGDGTRTDPRGRALGSR